MECLLELKSYNFERSFVKDLTNPLKSFLYFATMLQNDKSF